MMRIEQEEKRLLLVLLVLLVVATSGVLLVLRNLRRLGVGLYLRLLDLRCLLLLCDGTAR